MPVYKLEILTRERFRSLVADIMPSCTFLANLFTTGVVMSDHKASLLSLQKEVLLVHFIFITKQYNLLSYFNI